MVGNFKLIVVLFTFTILSSCIKKEKSFELNESDIVKSNLPILLDSLEQFDWTKIPVPKKFEKEKREDFKVELVDTILLEKNILSISNIKLNKYFKNKFDSKFQSFKINSSYLQNSNFSNINLVTKSSNDIYTLTVVFSNLLINESNKNACIVVTKKIGITMKKDIYFFERINKKWIYKGRDNISIG